LPGRPKQKGLPIFAGQPHQKNSRNRNQQEARQRSHGPAAALAAEYINDLQVDRGQDVFNIENERAGPDQRREGCRKRIPSILDLVKRLMMQTPQAMARKGTFSSQTDLDSGASHCEDGD